MPGAEWKQNAGLEASMTKKGVTVKITIKGPTVLNLEPIFDKIVDFADNQVKSVVPVGQEGLDLDEDEAQLNLEQGGKRRPRRRVRDGKSAAAGEAAN